MARATATATLAAVSRTGGPTGTAGIGVGRQRRSTHVVAPSTATVINCTPSVTGPLVSPASPTATPQAIMTGHVARPRQAAYRHSWAAVVHTSSTASVTHILAAASVSPLVAKIVTVHNVRCAPNGRHSTADRPTSRTEIATADGSRAANVPASP